MAKKKTTKKIPNNDLVETKKRSNKKIAKKTSRISSKKMDKLDSKVSIRLDEDKIIFAFLATFLSILGFLIAVLTKKDDEYVMFYAKQSLITFVIIIIASIVASIVSWIPLIGDIIVILLYIFSITIWVLSWVYALLGEYKYVPVVEIWAKKINL